MENKNNIKSRNYKIEIAKLSEEDGGGFLATVPTLPGCMSDGETQEEALTNVQDAIECWIETAEEIGKEIPHSDVYKSENDYSGKLSLRIPKSLHKKVSERADVEECSINQLIMMYVSMGIGNEYGKQHVSITLNNQSNETLLIDKIQGNSWKDFSKNNGIDLNNRLFDHINIDDFSKK